jgi:hypothetical protein
MNRATFAKLGVVLSSTFLFGFGVPTHVAIANRTIDEVQVSMQGPTPRLVFHNLEVPISGDRAAFDAILAHPDYFRMGAAGPDAFPDLLSGQAFHHTNRGILETDAEGGFPFNPFPGPVADYLEFLLPQSYDVTPTSSRTRFENRTPETYRSNDFGTLMLKFGLTGHIDGDPPDNFTRDPRILAFTMGYLSHAVGDGFMHARVNELSGDYFTMERGAGGYGEFTEEVKHMAIEELLDQLLPSELKNTNPAVNSMDRISGTAPIEFLDLFYQHGEQWNHVGGALYDYFRVQEDVFGAALTVMDPGRILEPLENQFREIVRDMINDLTGGLAPQGVVDAAINAFIDDLPQNERQLLSGTYPDAVHRVEQLRKKVVAFRQNWVLLSECTMQNIMQGGATANLEDHCRSDTTLNRITLNGVEDPFGLFQEELEDLFKGAGMQGAGDDFRTRGFNIKRIANYITSSFLLGNVQEIILPITLSDASSLLRTYLEEHRDEINERFFLVIPNLENLMVAGRVGVCETHCFLNDCAPKIAQCVNDAVADCNGFCTVSLLGETFNLCALAGCQVFSFPYDVACDEFVAFSGFTGFGQPQLCTATNFVTGCIAEIGQTGYDCARCTQQCVRTAREELELFDLVGVLLEALDAIDAVREDIRDVLQENVVEPTACALILGGGLTPSKGLRSIRDTFVTLRKFAATAEFLFAGRGLGAGPDYFAVNVAYLREDLNEPGSNWNATVRANSSQTALQALDILGNPNGPPINLFNGPFEAGFPGDCFTFDYVELDRSGFAVALQDISVLHDTPGPTAQRLLDEFGDDVVHEFLPFSNTVAGVKLLPVRSRADVVNMFEQAEVSVDALPWNSNQYSALCRDAGDGSISLLCDVVNSLDDPDCSRCTIDCEGQPPTSCNLDSDGQAEGNPCNTCEVLTPQQANTTRVDLERDLELDTDTGIAWRRSLSACANDLERSVFNKVNIRTPFALANTDEAFEGLYTKVFRCENTAPKFADFDSEDDVDGWTLSPNGTASFDATRRKSGAGSMRVCGGNFITMTSPAFGTADWSQLSSTVALEVFVPLEDPNPWWWGSLQMQVHVPGADLNSAWVGEFVFTNAVTRGQWNPVTFTLPSAVLAALEGDFANARFQFNLNVPLGTECWGFDNLRFDGETHLRTTFHRTGSRHLDVRTNPFLSFEVLSDWTAGTSVQQNLAKREHGNASLEVIGAGYKVITSRIFSATELLEVGTQLNVDLFVPDPQPNPYWVGQAQAFLTCPSGGLDNAYIGQRELTHLFHEEFNSLLFTLPANVRAALLGTHNDCRLSLVLNVNSGSGSFLFDKMGFVGDIVNR